MPHPSTINTPESLIFLSSGIRYDDVFTAHLIVQRSKLWFNYDCGQYYDPEFVVGH